MSWTWADFIPFYEYLFGEEIVEVVQPKELGFLEQIFSSDKFSLQEAYEHALDQIRLLQGREDAENTINRLHFDLCSTVFLATLTFFTLLYTSHLALRYGKPILSSANSFLNRESSRNVETDVKKLDTRMNFVENILTETFKHLSETNIVASNRLQMDAVVKNQVRVLSSAKDKLNEITVAIHGILKVNPQTGDKSVQSGSFQEGDSA
uniref:Uncharacterized protein n=1 Tax=Ciona savignyi TaxID=51511 RepID=H2Z2Z8_CIOSA